MAKETLSGNTEGVLVDILVEDLEKTFSQDLEKKAQFFEKIQADGGARVIKQWEGRETLISSIVQERAQVKEAIEITPELLSEAMKKAIRVVSELQEN